MVTIVIPQINLFTKSPMTLQIPKVYRYVISRDLNLLTVTTALLGDGSSQDRLGMARNLSRVSGLYPWVWDPSKRPPGH